MHPIGLPARTMLGILLAAAALAACSPPGTGLGGSSQSVAPESEDEKTIYVAGRRFAQSVEPLGLTPRELSVFLTGVRDAAEGKESPVPLEEYQARVATLLQERQQRAVGAEREASRGFIESAAAEEGARTLPSGLVFRELVAGDGPSPTPDDIVRVHYTGRLRDGTVFDSSVQRGRPAEFPLQRVIPCWTEALQLMKVGGNASIVCPSEIAYGNRGAPPRIPPGAALAFEVELLEILPPKP